MATRGRKPKPTAIKLLEGNPGRRPLNEHEPVPPKATIKCPAWLEPEAKKEWKRLAPALESMGVLTSVDISAFAGYCQAYGIAPHDYIIERAISKAQCLLLSTEKSILEICMDTGFQSVSSFNRNFKALSGETPESYRAIHK